MWLREELTTKDDIMNKEFKSKVTVSSVGVNSAGVYKEDILNGADPVLKEGLIPVTINNEGKVTRADVNKKWYNYANQEWANAVILEDDYEDPGAGKEIPEDQIESYFVWIPKYSYQLWDLGEYNDLTEIDETKPHNIPIRFGTTNTTDKKGECTTPMNSDNTQGLSGGKGQCKVGDYMTHPAFISFGVNGLWVGKFETGYDGATNTSDANVNPSDEADAISKANQVIIKPNVYSWRDIQPANAYTVSYNYKRDLDSHMMKNTEWGAVAYLSHSVYGNKEIRMNNASDYKTGYAAINVPTIGLTDTNESCTTYPNNCNEYGPSTGNLNTTWNTQVGYLASTTNNITGIYDMSGGSWEYVMSFVKDEDDNYYVGRNDKVNSNFIGKLGYPNDGNNKSKNTWTEDDGGISLPDEKYYDIYNSYTVGTEYTRRILGDATGELGPFQNVTYKGTASNAKETKISSWYNNFSTLLYKYQPLLLRGGNFDYGIESGIFAFSFTTGWALSRYSFRIVLALPEE